MADHTQDHYRGLILRDDRFSAANVTISPAAQQAGPVVGEPTVTAGHGYMDLEATGTTPADKAYQIRCVKPGNAKGTTTGGRFSWKNKTDPNTSWRDWHPVSMITSSEVLAINNSVLAGNLWPHAITSKDGYVHAVYAIEDSSGPTSGIYVRTLNPSTGVWSIANIGTQAISATHRVAAPCTIMELPTGRLIVLAGFSYASIDTFYSDDRGATWARSQAQSDPPTEGYGIKDIDPPATIHTTTVHYQAVYHNGYITLVREIITQNPAEMHEIDHYVSEDFGVSWRFIERFQPDLTVLVGSGTSLENVYNPCLIVDELGAVLMLYSTASIATVAMYTRKSTPYAKFADNPDFNSTLGTPHTAGSGALGNFTACVDQEGFLCVAHQGASTGGDALTGRGRAFCSRYDLRNPSVLIDDERSQNGQFYGLSGAGTSDQQWPLLSNEPRFGSVLKRSRSTMTPHKDGLMLITGTFTTKEGGVNSKPGYGPDLLLQLGGYSNYGRFSGIGNHVYLPSDTPENIAAGSSLLTATSIGTTTFVITADGMQMDSAATSHYFTDSGACAGGIYARVKVTTVASVSGTEINGNYATMASGGVELRIGKDRVQVFDVSGGYVSPPALSAIVTLPNVVRDWYVHFENGTSADTGWVMYKSPGDQVWTKIEMANTMASPGSVLVNPLFGHQKVGTTTSIWQSVQFIEGIHNDTDEWQLTNYHPIYQFGRPFSLASIYLDAGWSIESKGSAAFVADEWEAGTEYEHPIKVIHPEIAASPRVDWRSTSDDAEVIIEWNLNSGVATRPLSSAIGLHLNEINFKTAHLEGYNGSSWIAIGTVNTTADYTGLQYALSGNIVRPGGTATYGAKRYVGLEELRGSYAVFNPGSGSESIHAINHNSQGSYSAVSGTAHAKSAELEVAGDVSAVSATGTLEIREKQATLIAYEAAAAYEKYRLRIPVQDTAEGYFKIGSCLLGPLLVFGQDYSWGRTVAMTANQELTTGRAGDRIVQELAPVRRQVQFAWTEAWDALPIGGDTPTSFDHLTIGSTTGVAVRSDPTIMAGALLRQRGAKEPTVYLPRIPHMVPNTYTAMVLGQDRHIYGRIVSPVTQQTVLGDEGTNEAIVVNQIVIDEEL
tara:strand:+ start:1652 stop:5002 length:3351 start_codon:yes stop_codon:yes gene_type:complete